MGSSVRKITRLLVAASLVTGGAAFAAEPYRVGPGGSHATIQSALDDAVRGGVARDIHVAAGRWTERIRLELFDPMPPLVRVFGGWNAAFTERTDDPSATVLDGGGAGSVIEIDANTEGHLYFRGLTITGGHAETGGGLLAYLRGHARLTLEGNHIVGNRCDGDSPTAGGLGIFLWETSRLWMRENRVERNVVDGSGAANSGGVHVAVADSAYAQLAGNEILSNEARSATNGAYNAALGVFAWGDGAAYLERNRVEGNRAEGKAAATVANLAAHRPTTGANASWVIALDNQFLENVGRTQVEVWTKTGGFVRLAENVIARGTGRALYANAEEGSNVFLTNLTVARNDGAALVAHGTGAVHLSNTILFENGGDVSGVVTESHNFRDDPLFVDPASDYHLRSGSPAIDAGDGAPAGGLSLLDIDGDARRRGDGVDIGADEAAPRRRDGEPVCSIFPFTWRSTPACRCLSEPDLRHARCGGLFGGVFVNVRIPLEVKPADVIQVDWTIQPWEPLAGPYKMMAEAFLDGKWQPQQRLGIGGPGLKDGVLTREPFAWRLAGKEPTPVRTTLEYLQPGFKEPTRATIEVTMPDQIE